MYATSCSRLAWPFEESTCDRLWSIPRNCTLKHAFRAPNATVHLHTSDVQAIKLCNNSDLQ